MHLFVLDCILNAPLHLYRKAKQQQQQGDPELFFFTKVIEMFSRGGAWLRFLFVVSSILGIVVSPYYYATHLLIILSKSTILQNVTTAFTANAKPLLLTSILGMVMAYLFSIVGFVLFREDFDADETPEVTWEVLPTLPNMMNGNDIAVEGPALLQKKSSPTCETLHRCFVHILTTGIRNGGGVGDVMRTVHWNDDHFIQRTLFDFIFWVAMILIFLNMLFGIILDTFAALRDERSKIEEDLNTRCFICGLEASQLERKGVQFHYHCTREHNVWYYLYFMHHVKQKLRDNFTGQESYVQEKLERGDISFFPMGQCMSIMHEEYTCDNMLESPNNDTNLTNLSAFRTGEGVPDPTWSSPVEDHGNQNFSGGMNSGATMSHTGNNINNNTNNNNNSVAPTNSFSETGGMNTSPLLSSSGLARTETMILGPNRTTTMAKLHSFVSASGGMTNTRNEGFPSFRRAAGGPLDNEYRTSEVITKAVRQAVWGAMSSQMSPPISPQETPLQAVPNLPYRDRSGTSGNESSLLLSETMSGSFSRGHSLRGTAGSAPQRSTALHVDPRLERLIHSMVAKQATLEDKLEKLLKHFSLSASEDAQKTGNEPFQDDASEKKCDDTHRPPRLLLDSDDMVMCESYEMVNSTSEGAISCSPSPKVRDSSLFLYDGENKTSLPSLSISCCPKD